MTAKVLTMSHPLCFGPEPEAPCATCGHEFQDHEPACEAGSGCGGSCPCQEFQPTPAEERR